MITIVNSSKTHALKIVVLKYFFKARVTVCILRLLHFVAACMACFKDTLVVVSFTNYLIHGTICR